MWMDILGVAAGLLTLGVGISAASGIVYLGLKISDLIGGGIFGFMFWMGYAFAVVVPAFAGAFALAVVVGSWVCSL